MTARIQARRKEFSSEVPLAFDRVPAQQPQASEAVVRVRDLTISYRPGQPVVEGVSLEIASGQIASLIGPSGSGKSTILRAISGLHEPDGGEIELRVKPREIGFLFQDDALLPWRSARQNVALGLKLHGMGRSEAAAEADRWLARLGLAGLEERYPRQLSGGQRKRVALAQVLALRPKLLLMDEPFASLDAIVRHHVTTDLLRWVERERITVLLVTHDLEEAQVLSDTVYLLSRGPRAHIAGRYRVEIPRPRNLIAARGHPSFAPLLQRMWNELSDEVDQPGGAE